jgi:hypothetical protein
LEYVVDVDEVVGCIVEWGGVVVGGKIGGVG